MGDCGEGGGGEYLEKCGWKTSTNQTKNISLFSFFLFFFWCFTFFRSLSHKISDFFFSSQNFSNQIKSKANVVGGCGRDEGVAV